MTGGLQVAYNHSCLQELLLLEKAFDVKSLISKQTRRLLAQKDLHHLHKSSSKSEGSPASEFQLG